MLISGIAGPDAQSIEFARRHATSTVSAPQDRRGGFADYLAAIMNPARADAPAGDVRDAQESARSEPADSDASRVHDEQPPNPTRSDRITDDERETGDPSGDESAGRNEHADDRNAERASADAADAPDDGARSGASEDAAADATDGARADGDEAAGGSRGSDESETSSESAARRSAEKLERAKSGRGAKPETKTDARSAGVSSDTDDDASERTARVRSRLTSESAAEIDVEIVGKGAPSEASEEANRNAAGGRTDRTKSLASARRVAQAAGSQSAPGTDRKDRAQTATGSDRRGPDAGEKVGGRAERRVDIRDLRAAARQASEQREGGAGSDAHDENESGRAVDDAKASVGRDGRSSSSDTAHAETVRGDTASIPGSPRGVDNLVRTTGNPAAALRQALQDQVNGEIVRSARLIVRGNDTGEIRLNLKPEQLGTVRISLQMHDGHIAGRIIVDNQSVREVFEQNLAALQRAFQEAGLEAGGVEIGLADSGSRPDTGEGRPGGRTRVREAADRFGLIVPEVNLIDDRHDLVDVIV